jgi:hypothetical protein
MSQVTSRLVIAFAMTISACSVAPEISPSDRHVIALTKDAWGDKFGSRDEVEVCLENVGVASLAREGMIRECGLAPFLSIGCVKDRGIGFQRGKVLYLSPAVAPTHRNDALVQLTLRALCACTAKRGHGDPTDVAMMRHDVWIESTGRDSVEADVRRRLADGK